MVTVPSIAFSPKKLPSFTELVGSIPFASDASSSSSTSGPATPTTTKMATPPASINEEPSVVCDKIISTSPLTIQRPMLTTSYLQPQAGFSKTVSYATSAAGGSATTSSLPSPRSMASTPTSPTEYNNYIPVNVHLSMTMTPVISYTMPPATPQALVPIVYQPQHPHPLVQHQPVIQQVPPHAALMHHHMTPMKPQEATYGAPMMISIPKNTSAESFNTYIVSDDGAKHAMGGYAAMTHIDKKLGFQVNSKDSKRRYVCKVCARPFTTSGHLARHNRIHTGERKHQCPWPTCHARFARQDNCMQHYKTHVNGKRKSRKRADEIEEEESISSEVELPPQSVLAA